MLHAATIDGRVIHFVCIADNKHYYHLCHAALSLSLSLSLSHSLFPSRSLSFSLSLSLSRSLFPSLCLSRSLFPRLSLACSICLLLSYVGFLLVPPLSLSTIPPFLFCLDCSFAFSITLSLYLSPFFSAATSLHPSIPPVASIYL